MSTTNLLILLKRAITKSPQIYPHAIQIYEHSQAIYVLVATDDGTLSVVAFSEEDEAHITEIAGLLAPEGSEALFDGGLLRKLLAFAAKHPEFGSLLFKLLTGGLGS